MSPRELMLVKLCLSYCLSNLDDLLDAFEEDNGQIDYNGEILNSPSEDELSRLINEF